MTITPNNDARLPSRGNSPEPPPRMGIINRPPGSERFCRGGNSCVYTLPDRPGQVVKVPMPFFEYERNHEIERRIFHRLGEHPNVVKVFGMDQYGIWLQRAEPGCLRMFYKDGGYPTVTLQEKVTWSRDIALAQQYLHDKNVRHSDLSGRNLLIHGAAPRTILLCDFSGSYIDGQKAFIVGEDAYAHPDWEECSLPTIRSELHALGSTMYEIVTGTQPHGPLDGEAAKALMEKGSYPDVGGLPLGDVIRRCWEGKFNTAAEVAAAISMQCCIET